MAKTKKNLKLKIKKYKKSKKHNINNINKNNNSYMKINNTGFSEFIYKEDNKSPQKMTIKWDDDGNNTKIYMNTNLNGKDKKTTLNLSNDKIKELLGATTVVNKPIDQRLINDFSIILLPQQQMNLPSNHDMLFSPIMSDIDIIPMSSIKGKKQKQKQK
jgi:hypothetical protein